MSKGYPEGVVPATEFKNEFLPRVPSGILPFDVLTGGGIPLWKIILFHGNYSSGKTTTSLRIIGNFLREHKKLKVAYIDFEDSFDKIWVSNFVDDKDMDRLLVVTPDYGEQGIDIAIDLIKQPDVGFLFVDSLAEILPISDLDNSAEDDLVGLQARVINKLLRKVLPILIQARKTGKPLASIFLNQERAKIGARVFGEQTKKPGGYFQDFIASADFKFYVKQKDTASETKDAQWIDFGFKIGKSKISGVKALRSGVFRMALKSNPDEGIKAGDILSNAKMLVSLATSNDLITKKGREYSIGKGITTKEMLVDFLEHNPKEYDALYKKVINFYKGDL